MKTTYKGFAKDLKCSPNENEFQYEIGKTYEMDETPVQCTNKGFHSCEYPLDVFNYYPPANNRFAICKVDGKIDKGNDDSKIASSKIHVETEISIKTLVECAIKFIFDKVTWTKENSTSGDRSASQASGDRSASQASGYSSASQASGYSSVSQASGDSSASQASGDRSASQASGDRSASQASGDRSASQASGDSSASQASGGRSASQASGDRSASQALGDRSASQASGDSSASQASGYRSASQASGDRSASQASGYSSASQASGYSSVSQASGIGTVSTTTGYESESSITGIDSNHSMAVGFGIKNKAKAPLNCWITLSEWVQNSYGWELKSVKTAKVDGKKIKADTFYMLKNGKFVMAKSITLP